MTNGTNLYLKSVLKIQGFKKLCEYDWNGNVFPNTPYN